ncbi:DUF1289 domain-containing protein [Candidatus Pantoea formicae]|uniref:DUF1289 domain-containing protein n=1 Tax=Candidatus Pantoea formicae TaxID=2608355 RepID=UPI003ED8D8C4
MISMSVKSPCTDVCIFEGKNGWCRACGRTRKEAQEWRKMSPYHRKAIERALKDRVATMQIK